MFFPPNGPPFMFHRRLFLLHPMKNLQLLLLCLVLLCGCSKPDIQLPPANVSYEKYTILKGKNFSEKNKYKALDVAGIRFITRFDSSAIYQNILPENQYDINKLYGFADNNAAHNRFSARIGWRWSDNALRLFAYVYNAGQVESEEISTVAIGKDISCSITIIPGAYVFSVNDRMIQMPRHSQTVKGKGYQLYPYFGGDEPAPQDINIWIRDLPLD
jgi:hypothetical protein